MADEITLKALQDASLDAKSLEEVVNGADTADVTSRLGATYPTLSKAVRLILEQGTLDASIYRTRTSMNASGLPDLSYVLVTDDPVATTNGYYQNRGGTWTYLGYNSFSQAQAYVNANPMFKPKALVADEDLDNLGDGVFFIGSAAIGDTILNFPPLIDVTKIGIVVAYKINGIRYQRFYHYKTLEQHERTGNGGSVGSSFAWLPWTRVVSRADMDALITNTDLALSKKPNINLFGNLNLDAVGANRYEATVVTESDVPVLNMNTDALSAVFYDIPLDDKYFKVGKKVTFTAEAFSDGSLATGVDISLVALGSSDGIDLATGSMARTSAINSWQTLSTELVLPVGTKKVRVRFIRRSGNTVGKFRNPKLISDTLYAGVINPINGGSGIAVGASNNIYVSKIGNNDNDGSKAKPFLTIQKAVDSLPSGGTVTVLDSEDYRETVVVNNEAHTRIVAATGKRVNLFGSDKLVLSKTAGFTKVYQAPLATKPTGIGGNRGKPTIFEWGTPSNLIPADERHFLHRGLTHRLPFTAMLEVASKELVESTNGSWFWEAGVIYLSAVDGSNATLKRYEARVRPVLTHSSGTIELVRVTSWFSNSYGMLFSGANTVRSSCIVYGAQLNGFADNANITVSRRDIGAGCGNDGFNLTVLTGELTKPEIDTRLEAIYFDPYGHDNSDDGVSCHYRSDATIYGGLFEHNTKADVVHVTGANCVCYGTEARGTANGFYTSGAPDGDTERVKTTMRCVGTKSTNNGYAYRAQDDSQLDCDNVTAITPYLFGYYQTGTGAINTQDCKYDGDTLKAKSGNVVISNANALA